MSARTDLLFSIIDKLVSTDDRLFYVPSDVADALVFIAGSPTEDEPDGLKAITANKRVSFAVAIDAALDGEPVLLEAICEGERLRRIARLEGRVESFARERDRLLDEQEALGAVVMGK